MGEYPFNESLKIVEGLSWGTGIDINGHRVRICPLCNGIARLYIIEVNNFFIDCMGCNIREENPVMFLEVAKTILKRVRGYS